MATQVKVIISNTQVFVTGYSPNGATICFMENHNSPIDHASNSDAVATAKSVAFNYACTTPSAMCSVLIRPDATESEVLHGKYNGCFM